MKHYIKKITYLTILILLLILAGYPKFSNRIIAETSAIKARVLQPDIADKVLRFHVLANSDSKADQAVKLQVRDAIGAYLQPLLEESKTRAGSEAIVSENLDRIVEIANEILCENGYYYGATARICTTDFPEKTYGAFTFPSGTYDALEVTLGNGNGHNWWCVLYPNMCFRGSVYEVVDTDSGEVLKEVLSSDEYEAVLKSGNYKIRFKFLEYLE